MLNILLRNAIIDGKLKPSDKLPSEEQIAIQFGVSKTVVRETLGKLVAVGFIDKRSGASGGSYVKKFSSDRVIEVINDLFHLGNLSLDEIMEFRGLVEPIVLELAAERRTKSGDLNKMKTLHERLKNSS